jgi:hypothetical protein
MALEQLRALACIRVGLDAAKLGFLGGQHQGPYVALGQQLDDVVPRLGNQLIGEELAVTNDDAKCGDRFPSKRPVRTVQGSELPNVVSGMFDS